MTDVIPAVLWLYVQPPEADEDPDCMHHCERCGQDIPIGDPMAWQADGDDGRTLCLDCGGRAEDKAEATHG